MKLLFDYSLLSAMHKTDFFLVSHLQSLFTFNHALSIKDKFTLKCKLPLQCIYELMMQKFSILWQPQENQVNRQSPEAHLCSDTLLK